MQKSAATLRFKTALSMPWCTATCISTKVFILKPNRTLENLPKSTFPSSHASVSEHYESAKFKGRVRHFEKCERARIAFEASLFQIAQELFLSLPFKNRLGHVPPNRQSICHKM